MQKHTITVIPTEDPNVDVIDVQTDNIQFTSIDDLLSYIEQDEKKCAAYIANRKYIRSQRKAEASILHRFIRKAVAVCL